MVNKKSFNILNMKSQWVLYTNTVNDDKYLPASNAHPGDKDIDIKISSNNNNKGDGPNPLLGDMNKDKKPLHNYVKVLVEDPFNNREIILRVTKKQKGV